MTGERRFLHLIVLCFIACGLWSAAARADTPEPRFALVIGNSAYGPEIGNLANPANDAKLMAATLRKVGFEVIELENADRRKMSRAIVDFGEALAKAGGPATGLFFYAGHGIQVAGDNYLIPIDADISREGDVEAEAVSSDLVLRQMDFAGNAVNIVILDACRNNPLTRGFRSASRGLGEPKVKPRGSFIAYSTAPGDVAADGAGDDSPYALALSQAILKPGAALEEVFRDVRSRVMAATNQKQVPWDSSSMTAPFYFIPSTETAAAETPVAPAAPSADKSVEIAYWNSIANSSNPALFQSYLRRFPDGDFAELAEAKLAELQQADGAAKSRSQETPTADESQQDEPQQQASAASAPPATPPAPVTGKSFRDCGDCPEMVTVPAGSFTMGAAPGEDAPYVHEEPQHPVTIRKAFAVGKYEVTIGEFRAFVQATGFDAGNSCFSDPTGSGSYTNASGINWQNPGFAGYRPSEQDPVVCVSWDAARAYAQWLSQKTGKPYRLLTEAEWEYAARGGTITLFPWGNDANAACTSANVADEAVRRTPGWMPSYITVDCNDAGAFTVPAGRYQPNAFGLYDMIGNANEWVADCYTAGYAGAPADGSAADVPNCQQRAVRGAGWTSIPFLSRSAARSFATPLMRVNVDGFRIAREF
jgi:carboxyl-terminal processing protease